jgi:[ribosomal protein S5]-alanine N-acetyltransferase
MVSAAQQSLPMSALPTERLILRKISMEDRDAVFAWARDPEVSRYGSWDSHRTPHDTETFIESCLKQYDREGLGPWAIELRETNLVVGTCGFGYVDRLDRRGGIGYFLARSEWGNGFATEAVRAVLRFGFGPLALNRIEARCVPANTASERVMQKVGMKYEGLLRQDMFKAGAFLDLKLYARIAEDCEPPL